MQRRILSDEHNSRTTWENCIALLMPFASVTDSLKTARRQMRSHDAEKGLV